MGQVERAEVNQFLEWAAAIFAAPDVARRGELDDGFWCDSVVPVRSGEFPTFGRVRLAEADPEAVRVDYSFVGEVPREWFGKLKITREWGYSSGHKTYAEILDGALAGRHMVIERYPSVLGDTKVYVFSTAYLDADAKWRAQVFEEWTGIPDNPHRFRGNQN
jgi:hypothetical protein